MSASNGKEVVIVHRAIRFGPQNEFQSLAVFLPCSRRSDSRELFLSRKQSIILRGAAMDNRSQLASGGEWEASPEDLENAYAKIRRTCKSHGLSASDADDVAQDVFLWLLRNRYLVDVVTMPWLGAVTRKFLMRHRRARARRTIREAEAVRDAPLDTGNREWAAVEDRLALDRLESYLSEPALTVLKGIRGGASFDKSLANLGIPKGSRSWARGRLTSDLSSITVTGTCERRHAHFEVRHRDRREHTQAPTSVRRRPNPS
jgi:hypothetical protein